MHINKHIVGFVILLLSWSIGAFLISLLFALLDPNLERYAGALGLAIGIYLWVKLAKKNRTKKRPGHKDSSEIRIKD